MSSSSPDWPVARFSEVFDFKGGSQPPKSEFSSEPREGYVRLLQIRDFEDDSKAVYIKDNDRWPKCSENDIMIGRYGASVGKILAGKAGAYNVALVRLIFDPRRVHAGWARHFCTSDYFQDPLKNISRSAQNGFNKEDLADIEFPFPPIDHQRRIAAVLDSLFQRSRKAREELARIPRLVERYKKAILATAFCGDLTNTWRAKHAPPHLTN
jgi:type I restriction enzyme S subunit